MHEEQNRRTGKHPFKNSSFSKVKYFRELLLLTFSFFAEMYKTHTKNIKDDTTLITLLALQFYLVSEHVCVYL